MIIKKDFTILFQGDSVTDCGRNYEDSRSLGTGYAMIASALFSKEYPELNVKFLNRGISGNRSIDLKNRWEEDCIKLNPDVVSILIGVNDTWRKFDNNEPTSAEQYRDNFHYILNEIKEKLGAKIIICEPFILPVTEEQKNGWREDLDPKIQVAKELAKEFDAIYVPFDEIFTEAAKKVEPKFWAEDGVHPTNAGHAMMAEYWLKAVGVCDIYKEILL